MQALLHRKNRLCEGRQVDRQGMREEKETNTKCHQSSQGLHAECFRVETRQVKVFDPTIVEDVERLHSSEACACLERTISHVGNRRPIDTYEYIAKLQHLACLCRPALRQRLHYLVDSSCSAYKNRKCLRIMCYLGPEGDMIRRTRP